MNQGGSYSPQHPQQTSPASTGYQQPSSLPSSGYSHFSPLPLTPADPYQGVSAAVYAQTEDKALGQKFTVEKPEVVQECLRAFMTSVQPSPPVTVCMQFLRQSKFNAAKAIKGYHHSEKMRVEKGFPSVIPFSEVEGMYRSGFYLVGGRDLCGRRLIYARPALFDLSDQDLVLKTIWCVLQGVLRDEISSQRGITLVLDAQGVQPHNFSRELAGQVIKTYQGGLPVRLGAICILHEPWFFKSVFAVISLFMKHKIRRRVRVMSNDTRQLLSFAAADQLPLELGGTMDYTSPAAIERFCRERRALDDKPMQ